ncbi:SusC/RagA family TonB-linked outer membrane protein [Chitinophaga lutea]
MMRKYALPFFVGMMALSPLTSEATPAGGDTAVRKAPASPGRQVVTGPALALKDTVPVLFGVQHGNNLLQSYGIVRTDELLNVPVTSLENVLYGKLAGLFLYQVALAPGEDAASASLRGSTPLIVVDGVPRLLTSIDPEQVASVSVLRDALATAMYGHRGANGVILVTTRKGFNGKKKISFTAQTAVQQMLKTPQFLGAYDYARLYNEALANDGRLPVYSQADLDAWKNGTDPYGHPDVSWYDEVLKDQAAMQRYNLNISGGNRISRYFVDLDYLNQQGYFVTDPKNTYETNNFYKRFNFRSNVDVDLTKTTLMNLGVAGRIRNGNQPGARTADIYSNILNTPNNAYPVLNYDGMLAGNNDYQNNIYGQVTRSGYRPSYNRHLLVDLTLRQRLDAILPGLYMQGFASFNSYYNEELNRSKSFAVYQVKMNPGVDTVSSKIGTDGQQTNSSAVNNISRQAYTEFRLGYDSTFGKHRVQVTGLFFRDSYTPMKLLPVINSSVSARLAYDFAGKYLFEYTMAYAHNNMYAPANRWAYYPAAGIGWNVAKEDWFRAALPSVGTLKLRASYGLTGNSMDAGYYRYIQYFTSPTTYSFGNPPSAYNAIQQDTLANPAASPEKTAMLNLGVDVMALNDRLEFSAEVFRYRNMDILMRRGENASGVIGQTLPMQNIGETTYKGFELTAGYRDQVGALAWSLRGNVSFFQTRVEEMQEVTRRYEWNRRTGQPLSMPFGYEAIGFYQSPDDVKNSPLVEGYSPVPGDIKYKDLNNDGIINQYDERAIGSDKPLVFYGLQAALQWKGLDFSMLWQGAANRRWYLNGANAWEFLNTSMNGGPGQAQEMHLGRWTPATAASATYPRLTVNGNVNNHRSSTFWMKDASYLRLKTVELGYTLPARWVSHVKLQSVRAFASGYNLLTFTPLEWHDPEALAGGYPNQRVINFGLNIQL